MRIETQKDENPGWGIPGFSKKNVARQASNSIVKLYSSACRLSSLFLNYTIQPAITQGILAFAVLVARPGGVA